MTAAARLEADGLDPFPLTIDEGFSVDTLDLGFPAMRAVTSSRADSNGEYDTTKYHGARAVSLGGKIVASATLTRQQVLDRLRSFLRPDLRPYLYFTLEDGGDERRIMLRGDANGAPIKAPGAAAVTVGWRAPDGVQESATEATATASATAAGGNGRTYSLTFPRSYPASGSPAGAVDVVNAGNITAYPVLKLFGPCTGPAIENQTTGGKLSFPTLALGGGEWLELDTRTRTARLNGLANQSRSNLLDFAASSWFGLAPGTNRLRYFPSSFDAGCEAVVVFRSTWL